MTPEQLEFRRKSVRDKTLELFTNLIEDGFIDTKLDQIFRSGAVDLEDFDDDYFLAKIFAFAIAKECLMLRWRPLSRNGYEIAANLAHFI